MDHRQDLDPLRADAIHEAEVALDHFADDGTAELRHNAAGQRMVAEPADSPDQARHR